MAEQQNSRIGKKISTRADLATWVKEMKNRERLRHRLVWIDWVNVLAAFHNRSDLRASADLQMVSRMSRRDLLKLRELTSNYVQPHVRTVTAKIQKSRPILECLPSTTDEDDIQAAKVGDRFLKSEWYSQQMDIKRIDKAQWLGTTGNGLWHTFFDRADGPLGPDGIPLGQLQTESLSPFKVVFEPHRNTMKSVRWAIISQRLPVDQVQAAYQKIYAEQNSGEELNLTREDSAKEITDGITDNYLGLLGISDTRTIDDSDFIDIDIVYHLPSAWYEDGIYAIVANEKVLYVGPYPYSFLGRLPLFHFREIPCPWRFYGDTGTVQVLNTQDIYHDLRTMERRYHKANINTKLLVPMGVRVKTERLASGDNEVIYYKGKNGQKPDWAPARSAPSSIFQSIGLAREEITRASGVGEASGATPPAGVTSGRALLSLQEQDDTRLGLTVQLAEPEYAEWGRCNLLMAKEFYTAPRKYQVVGNALSGGMFFFERASLKDTRDVRCVPGTALPQNKIAKQQNVLELYGAGIFGDPKDPETLVKVRKMLEFGQGEDAFDDDAQDEANSEKENLLMLQTMQPAPVKPVDNHLIHIKGHLRRAKGEGVYDNPVAIMVFYAHIQQHQIALNPQAAMVSPQQLLALQQPQQQPQQSVATTAPISGGQAPTDLQTLPRDQGVTNENLTVAK